MNKLIHELQRLYLFNDQQGPTLALLGPDDMVRAMVLGFAKASAWETVAHIYEGLQTDLALPAPAIAVSGKAGYQLWLSLAEGMPRADVVRFLAALRARYAADLPEADLSWLPDLDGGMPLVPFVPAQDAATGKWSAFIDPSMGSMFVDEPGLEMAPSMDRQADMLARLKSMSTAEFRAAMALIDRENESEAAFSSALLENVQPDLAENGVPRSTGNFGQKFKTPQSFLLAVMNAESVSLAQRIDAAKALLPYYNNAGEVLDER